MIMDGKGATELAGLPELYDDAIETISRLPAYAEYGLERLREVKATAAKKAASVKPKSPKPTKRKK